MKSGTCFRLMELIKNVKYVLRGVVLKASSMNYPSSEGNLRTSSGWNAVKIIVLGTIEKNTVDTINLSQQSIWLCNQFFKKGKKRMEIRIAGRRKKRRIMMKLKWISLFYQSCKVCIKTLLHYLDHVDASPRNGCYPEVSRPNRNLQQLLSLYLTFMSRKEQLVTLKKLHPEGATFLQSNFLLSPNT